MQYNNSSLKRSTLKNINVSYIVEECKNRLIAIKKFSQLGPNKSVTHLVCINKLKKHKHELIYLCCSMGNNC